LHFETEQGLANEGWRRWAWCRRREEGLLT